MAQGNVSAAAEQAEVAETSPAHTKPNTLPALTLGAIGVVYGDIGTSPIYALREAVRAASGDRPPTDTEILGVLSIIVWALILIVAIKYALIVLRADNRGEGGTLSLMALARRGGGSFQGLIVILGLVGAALFFGDALITPAISVLSAVEGLEVVTPRLTGVVLPLTVVILIALFWVQRFGTGSIASVFGPLTALWFLALGASGLWYVIQSPGVLAALSPWYAVDFLVTHQGVAMVVIGAAFLAVTGAEALYADLGHFGRKPIVIAWFALVFPCLLLSYFGQGAYILDHAGSVGQPLFEMVPGWATLPMVLLATIATVIASQAVITGAFSLTRQAIQLGFLPRLDIQHTSETQSGQIYLPQVNLILLIGVVILVLEFGSSSALAHAYGIAVTAEMVVTALLLFFVLWRVWGRGIVIAAVVVVPFLLLESAFLWANIQKIPDGGYAAIAVAAALTIVMLTWRRGSSILFHKTRKSEMPLPLLVERFAAKPPTLVDGTAVFFTSDPDSAPTALLHSLKHYHVLHRNNVILTVTTDDRPTVPECERIEMEKLSEQFMRVTMRFGYMEQPNVPKALAVCRKQGWKFDIMTTSFFLSRRQLKPSTHSGMPMWQDRLYILLARNASDATAYFRLPTGRVVEVGTQVAI